MSIDRAPQDEAMRLREGLEEVLRIGGKPWSEIGGEWKRDLRRRGQRMMDAANRALKETGH